MFSNEDLKRQKTNARLMRRKHELWKYMKIETFFALLARLEAAELCARYLDAISEGQRSPRENEALMAWRKEAGK